MRTLGVLLFACVLSCIVVIVSSTEVEIRGVAPYEQQFYKSDPFKCRNEPSRQIPASRINDNYCDCSDGSDEPGTSACVNGIFYCVNKGFKGTTLFSSQVNDGICDCCDGSDEYEGKVKCTNDCEIKGAEMRKQQEEEKAKIEKGLDTKKQWIDEATKTLSEKRGSIDGLKAEVEKLKKVVEDLEGKILKEFGGEDKDKDNNKERENINNENEKKARRDLSKERREKERRERRLAREEKKREGKIHRQTKAEKRGFEEKERAEQDVINERKKELERIAQEKLEKEQKVTEEEEQEALRDLLQAEPKPPKNEEEGERERETERENEEEEEQHRTEGTVGEEPHHHHRGEESTPQPVDEETELLKTIREGSTQDASHFKEIFNFFDRFKNWLVASLQDYHILSTEEEKREYYYEEGKRKIEEELANVRRDLSTAESNLKSTEDILKLDFGTSGEFFKLNGNCYDFKTREYTYTMCPYGETKQGHTSLGRFEKWEPAYNVMHFTNGQQCWGGPKRSAKVTFLCGAENELYDIQEPNKCEYAMKFNTPAACSPAPLEFLEHAAGGLPHF